LRVGGGKEREEEKKKRGGGKEVQDADLFNALSSPRSQWREKGGKREEEKKCFFVSFYISEPTFASGVER